MNRPRDLFVSQAKQKKDNQRQQAATQVLETTILTITTNSTTTTTTTSNSNRQRQQQCYCTVRAERRVTFSRLYTIATRTYFQLVRSVHSMDRQSPAGACFPFKTNLYKRRLRWGAPTSSGAAVHCSPRGSQLPQPRTPRILDLRPNSFTLGSRPE